MYCPKLTSFTYQQTRAILCWSFLQKTLPAMLALWLNYFSCIWGQRKKTHTHTKQISFFHPNKGIVLWEVLAKEFSFECNPPQDFILKRYSDKAPLGYPAECFRSSYIRQWVNCHETRTFYRLFHSHNIYLLALLQCSILGIWGVEASPPKNIVISTVNYIGKIIQTRRGQCTHCNISQNCLKMHQIASQRTRHFKKFPGGPPRKLFVFGHSGLLPQTINPR